MLGKIRSSLTYANVMATIAVFMALGGGAYAAVKLPKNSVGSAQLKKNAVTSKKVKNGALLAADFKAGQLPAGPQGAKGDPGATGPKGDAGATGLQGPTGDTGAVGPTEGVASDFFTATGVTLDSQATFDPVTLTTTRAGRLFVSKPITNFDLTCSTGASASLWASLDGVRVPGVVYTVSLSTKYNLNFTGVTQNVIVPGDHVLALQMRCASGSVGSSGGSVAGAGTLVVLGG